MVHLSLIVFSTLRNLTKNLCPRVGIFVVFLGGIKPNHIVIWACLCNHLEIVFVEKNTGFFGGIKKNNFFSLLDFNIYRYMDVISHFVEVVWIFIL